MTDGRSDSDWKALDLDQLALPEGRILSVMVEQVPDGSGVRAHSMDEGHLMRLDRTTWCVSAEELPSLRFRLPDGMNGAALPVCFVVGDPRRGTKMVRRTIRLVSADDVAAQEAPVANGSGEQEPTAVAAQESERVAVERALAEEHALAEREQAERDQAKQEQAEREAAERDAAERDAAEREAAEREAAERDQAKQEQAEREAAERDAAERDAAEREAAEREAAEREAAEREAAERDAAEREAAEREAAEREAAEREAAEREAAEREAAEREAAERESAEREAAEREAAERESAEREQAGRKQAASAKIAARLRAAALARVAREARAKAGSPAAAEPQPAKPSSSPAPQPRTDEAAAAQRSAKPAYGPHLPLKIEPVLKRARRQFGADFHVHLDGVPETWVVAGGGKKKIGPRTWDVSGKSAESLGRLSLCAPLDAPSEAVTVRVRLFHPDRPGQVMAVSRHISPGGQSDGD